MLYELRIYEAVPGRIGALHDRFANVTQGFFDKHGIRVMGYWEDVVGTSNRLLYIVEWQDLAHRERAWGAFQSDPDWIAARAKTEENGPIVARIINTIMRPTPYSPPH